MSPVGETISRFVNTGAGWLVRSDVRDRVQLVILAYETGLVGPGR